MITEFFDVIDAIGTSPSFLTVINVNDVRNQIIEKWKINTTVIIFYDHGTGDKYGLLKYNTIDGTWTRLTFKDFLIPRNTPKKSTGYMLAQRFLKIWETYPDAIIVTEKGTFVACGGFGNSETRYFLEYQMKNRGIACGQLREVDNRLVANESKAKGKTKKYKDKEMDKHTHFRDAQLICEAILKTPERAHAYNFNKPFYPKKRHRSVRPMDDDYNHQSVLLYGKTSYDINDPIWSEEFRKLCGIKKKGKKGIWVWHWEHVLPLFMAFEEHNVEDLSFFLKYIMGAFEGGPKSFYRKARDYLNIEHFKQSKGEDYFELKADKNGKMRNSKKKFTGEDWSPSRPIVHQLLREFHKNTLQFHIDNNIAMGSNVKVTIREYYWGRYSLGEHDPESYLNKYWKPVFPNTPSVSFEQFYYDKLEENLASL